MRARFRLVRLLGLRWLRVHPIRTVLATVAVAAGISLAMSVVFADSSITWSFEHFSAKVAGGAQLRVIGATARGGLEEKVVGEVAGTPGVERAVPVVQAVTETLVGTRHTTVIVLGIGGTPAGSIPTTAPPEASTSPASLRDVAPEVTISQNLARRFAREEHEGSGGTTSLPLRTPSLATDSGELSLTGAHVLASLDGLGGGEVVTMPLTLSQQLFARDGRLDAVYVVPARGVDLATLTYRLQQAVGPANGVVPAGSLPPEAAVVVNSFLPLLALLAVLAVGISVVLVHDIVDLAFSERRRPMAVVAALGGSPGSTLLPVVEVAVLGVAGGTLGVVGGAVVAHTIVGTLGGYVRQLSGVSLGLHISVPVGIVAPVAGLLVALGAAFGPVRRARRVAVAAEISGRDHKVETTGRVALRAGVTVCITLAGLIGCRIASWNGSLSVWQYPFGIACFVVTIAAVMLAVGNLAPLAMSAVRRTWTAGQWRTGVTVRLALANLVRSPARTGTMAVVVAGAVGVAFVAASFNRSVAVAIEGSVNLPAAHWVYVSEGNAASVTIDSEQRFTPTELAALGRVPGVSRIDRQVGVVTGHTAGSVIGVETADDLRVTGISLLEGSTSPALLRRGETIVGAALARRQRLKPGSFARLDTPSGIALVRVAGVWENGDFNGASAFVSESEMSKLYGPEPPTNVYAYAKPGVSVSTLARRIDAAHIAPDVTASTPAQTVAADVRAAAGQVTAFWVLQRALVALTFVAVLSTLVLAGAQRRKEYAALVAIGVAPRGLAAMIVTEGTVVGVAGAVLGGVVCVASMAGLVTILPLVIGYRDPYELAPAYWVGYGIVAVVVTVAASLLPAWRATKVPVIEALRED